MLKSLQLYLFKTLWTAGSSVHGILQARPPPDDLPNPGIKPASLVSPALAGGFFTTAPPGKPKNMDIC